MLVMSVLCGFIPLLQLLFLLFLLFIRIVLIFCYQSCYSVFVPVGTEYNTIQYNTKKSSEGKIDVVANHPIKLDYTAPPHPGNRQTRSSLRLDRSDSRALS